MAATIGDTTDPVGTKRPNERPNQASTTPWYPTVVEKRAFRVNLPSHVDPMDPIALGAYRIGSISDSGSHNVLIHCRALVVVCYDIARGGRTELWRGIRIGKS